jgi:hypothetical protein
MTRRDIGVAFHQLHRPLKRVFGEVGQWVYDQTSIEAPADGQDFDVYQSARIIRTRVLPTASNVKTSMIGRLC